MNLGFRCTFIVLLAATIGAPSRMHGAEAPRENDVKALFLLNFARFIEWPREAFEGPRDPITMCVFETNPIGNALREAVRGEMVNGRALAVQVAATAPEIGSCHLLFVPVGGEARALRLVNQTQNWAVTVGESERFLTLGGAVKLFLDGARVRFSVNLQPVDQRSIRISARLLQVASDVQHSGSGR